MSRRYVSVTGMHFTSTRTKMGVPELLNKSPRSGKRIKSVLQIGCHSTKCLVEQSSA